MAHRKGQPTTVISAVPVSIHCSASTSGVIVKANCSAPAMFTALTAGKNFWTQSFSGTRVRISVLLSIPSAGGERTSRYPAVQRMGSTSDYQANSAWQQIVLLAHNLLTNFQIESGLVARNRTLRNTGRWPLKSARTLRFELFNRAGQLVHPEGRAILRLQRNKQIEKQFQKIAAALRKAA